MWQREDQLVNSDQFEAIVLGFVNYLGAALEHYGLSPRKLRVPPFPHFSFQVARTNDAIFLVLGQSVAVPMRYARFQDLRQVMPPPIVEQVTADCEQQLGWESCFGVAFSPTTLTEIDQRNKELEEKAKSVAAQFAAQVSQGEVDQALLPPSTGTRPRHELVLPRVVVEGTRGYIEKVVDQINGTYENGCFDACAVMIRRLIETLIIEVFEGNALADRITSSDGEFLSLKGLITALIDQKTWHLGRNTKKALETLPTIKAFGDFSAHNRRYNAYRDDIDKMIPDLRVVVQELLTLAKLK